MGLPSAGCAGRQVHCRQLHGPCGTAGSWPRPAVQNLIDDPALLALQLSRRLPLAVRTGAGRALPRPVAMCPEWASRRWARSWRGISERAEELLEEVSGVQAPLASEVAVLLDRLDLVRDDSAASTRARAAWSRGDLSGAVRILETGGRGARLMHADCAAK